MLWDYIVEGGGLGGSVASSRLHEYLPAANILLLEAGTHANNREDIMWYNSTNPVYRGEFNWNYTTTPQVNADLPKVNPTQGRALGGGTVINKNMKFCFFATSYMVYLVTLILWFDRRRERLVGGLQEQAAFARSKGSIQRGPGFTSESPVGWGMDYPFLSMFPGSEVQMIRCHRSATSAPRL
ncbi:hypothetical protein TruAng_005883 [Truncatella angustata]|nr:hypothetical protein TruAng_005883 [Truncatella angustata]